MFCTWTLPVSQGNFLSLTIHSLNITKSDNCNDNYLEIREKDENGKLLGIFCGYSNPTNISVASGYWIRYKTDNENINGGFLAEYRHLDHSDIQGLAGAIESPFYPKYVLYDGVQTYRISVEHGNLIHLDFMEFILGSASDHCNSHLHIYDGYDATGVSIMEIECNDIPNSITSQTNMVFIELYNTQGNEYKFKLNWRQVDKSTIKNETVSSCNSVVTLNSYDQIMNITSPDYPNGYKDGLNCTWILQSGDPTSHPTILIRYIDLEESDGCTADYLKIFSNRDDGSWRELAKLCDFDEDIGVFFSGTPNLKLEFISDHGINGTGFLARTMLQCGGVMNEPTGIINYNSSLLVRNSCMWNITVRRGRTIKFEFISLNLDKVDNKCMTSIYIRNGINEESPLLGDGLYCGTDPTAFTIPQTSSNKAFVKLVTNMVPHGNFKLKYEEKAAECGGNVFVTKENFTEITSPNYPNIPTPFTECIWTAMAPAGEIIQIEFIDRFDLITGKDFSCDKEYVELKAGSTENARPIGTFCGNRLPPTQHSKSNMVRIKFYTDIPEPRNGFKMKLFLEKCGGIRRSSSGTITSPKYPASGAYPKNSVCEYRIIGAVNTIYDITFVNINLPPKIAGSCREDKDHVIVYSVVSGLEDTENETLSEMGKYCGDQAIPTFKSQSNKLLIVFKTFDSTELFKGFNLKYNSTKLACGGEFEGASGEFTSPNYPLFTSIGYCEWKIIVPKGRRVKIEFLDVDILTSNQRFMQRIAFYNDFTHLNRIKMVSGANDTQPIYSTDNKMMISFWVRMATRNRGFKMRYSSDENSICEGDFSGRTGVIQSPTVDNMTSFACEYTRNSSATGTLGIVFTEMSFIGRTFYNCRHVSTVVYVEKAVQLKNTKLLGRFCQNSTDITVRSPFPDTNLVIKQSQFFGKLNVKVNYKFHECGGLIRSGNGYRIKNPSFASTYGRVDCAWFVEYNEGYSVKINVTKLDMKLSCQDEFLKVYNGPTASHPLIATYCGNSVQNNEHTRISQHYYVYVEYYSKSYDPNSNFEMLVEPSSTGCGGIINKYVYSISLPLTDNQYKPNTECIWEIRADSGYHIGVQFINRFYIEDSANCTNDFVEMFDFIDEKWVSLGKACGRDRPKIFNSTADRMKVLFRSNEKVQGEGFTIQWQQNCGGIFNATDRTKIIMSPGHPDLYSSSMFCNYTIMAPTPEQNVNVDFKEFDLELVPKCLYDNVTLYKVAEYVYPPGTEKIGTYCGTKSPGFVRAKGKIDVIFWTDRWIEKKGFLFEYYLDSCNNVVNSSRMITSPSREGAYLPSLDCIWNITAPIGKKIVIKFESFAIEHQDECYFDRVDIYSFNKMEDKYRVLRLCNNFTELPPIIVHNNTALVHLKTDQSHGFSGFSAAILFSPQCDQTIELTEENRTRELNPLSFDRSNGLEPLLECAYLVTGPRLSTISIRFNELHLADCQPEINRTKCSCDFVEVYDGNSPFGQFMGRFCDYSKPNVDLVTSTSSMYIRLKTDAVRSSTGFIATLEMRPPICGNPVIDMTEETSYEISSPGSNSYPPYLRCLWTVETTLGKIFDITFEKFDLKDSDVCSDDYLVIEEDAVKDYITEGLGESTVYKGKASQTLNPSFSLGILYPNAPHKYCGSQIPHDYISQTNKINIRFVTDSYVNKTGFKLKLNLVSACNRNYTSLQGRIHARDFQNCLMHITVPENYTISIYFKSLHLYYLGELCQKSNVKIYDGSYETGELLRTFCGFSLPEPIFSQKNQVSIKINMDPDKPPEFSYHQLDATYIASDQGPGCGGEVFNYGGVFR